MDATTRLVCNLSETVLLVACTDVASLWSAARVQQYLGETGGRERVALVLNRFRKIAGFSEADAEAAAGVKLLWKIPNQYFAVSTAIDRGIPLMHQHHTEIARSFIGLAHLLTENDVDVKRKAWSLFKTV
jgi:Flp pilus assembly CpaE family ATPase